MTPGNQGNLGIVLDASVGLKLVLDEEHRERAQALFRQHLQARTPVLGPPLLFGEVTNALHQRARRTTLTQEEAREALETFLSFPIQQIQPEGIYERALAFAASNQIRSVYDCIYVVTAQRLGVELWTADQNLLNALGSAAPWVRWIGDYPLSQKEETPL
ncbi:MAG: type II toxin-antitoxin system VapC family toxin [Chloroflexi bacterium]|nr:type II toxin-antitoxin system VapC family toxin [Chloroflexota bacterium]